jgi:glycosyltransferase involved in cell wall biosynthesis
MSEARFLFVVADAPGPTVIDSQVVDTVIAVAREGVRFDLLFLPDPRPWLEKRGFYAERARDIATRTGTSVRVIPAPRRDRDVGPAITAALIGAELLRQGPRRRAVVHARSDSAGYPASLLARVHPGVRYVYDSRGDVASEYRLLARSMGLLSEPRIEARVAKRIRHREAAVAGASHVLAVSTVLRDALARHPGFDAARSSVVPCVADAEKFGADETERRAARAELGVEDRFVVVFPGRIGAWHFSEETFRVVRGLMDADPKVFFLIVTPDRDAAAALAGRLLPEGRFSIRSAAHHEVPRLLRASDLGVLLRAPDPLNEMACPTKFAEYVMTGLPVLISAGIGDCSPFVREHRAGAVIDAPDPAAAVAALAAIRAEPDDARRARIAALGAQLSRQRYAREMAALYRRLADGP